MVGGAVTRPAATTEPDMKPFDTPCRAVRASFWLHAQRSSSDNRLMSRVPFDCVQGRLCSMDFIMAVPQGDFMTVQYITSGLFKFRVIVVAIRSESQSVGQTLSKSSFYYVSHQGNESHPKILDALNSLQTEQDSTTETRSPLRKPH